jgi:hypothetical protein
MSSNHQLANLIDTLNANAPAGPGMARLVRDGQRLAADLRAMPAMGLRDYFRASEGLPSSATAVLPDCSGFQGTGTRCESCRVRKAIHN